MPSFLGNSQLVTGRMDKLRNITCCTKFGDEKLHFYIYVSTWVKSHIREITFPLQVYIPKLHAILLNDCGFSPLTLPTCLVSIGYTLLILETRSWKYSSFFMRKRQRVPYRTKENITKCLYTWISTINANQYDIVFPP